MQSFSVDLLTTQVDGLTYPSESDAPFDVFCWPAKNDSAREEIAAHAPPGATLQELSINDFFAPLKDTDDANRFIQLRRTLEAQLSGLTVFRAGRIEVQIYLIGKTLSNQWAGVHTVSVET